MMVLPLDVARYLGKGDDTTVAALAEEHLPVVTTMLKHYVRGNGFDVAGNPDQDLAAVIVSATARAMSNPEHTVSQSVGAFQIRQGIFDGWTLPELAILHTYRRRTA